jgi:hypothetical protein
MIWVLSTVALSAEQRKCPKCVHYYKISIATIFFRRLNFAQSSDCGVLRFHGALSDADRFEAVSLVRNYLSLSDKGTYCEISTLYGSRLLVKRSGTLMIRLDLDKLTPSS